ncbi:hypothetical protein [uncultured Psychrobacter sp.]|uniref:hypothetical protein n=1 Tax=uncultured Psychrobacter sp. TaxID=259303 RepID=UPI002593D7CA|nr:hypothetical protein [uncultured Psychrobacter sp.]
MYVGHLAIGLALKSKFPNIPALTIMLGVGFLDIIDGLLILFGINHVTANLDAGPYLFFDLTFIDWDHSLLMAVILSIVWALFFIKDRRVALIAGFACFSHWLADWPMHNMDLALYPYAAEHMGYGLWGKWGTGSWVFEGFFSLALIIYAWFNFKKEHVSILWPTVLLVVSFFQLSPWFSPMKKIAAMPEQTAILVHGIAVFLGFLIPSLLLIWLINRAEKKVLKIS